MIELIGPSEISRILSSVLTLIAYLVVASYATRLTSELDLPGTRLIAWSVWFLAFVWLPLMVFFWTDAFEHVLWITHVTDILTTVPILMGAYGFRKMAVSLLSTSTTDKQ